MTTLVRRRRLLLTAALTAMLVAGLGLVLAARIKSPAQLAAESKPPEPTLITAVVERTVLHETVVIRGTVSAQHQFEITPTPAGGSQDAVVTAIGKQTGSQVGAGEVIIEVSGRPLIALPGEVPAYRDLKPGDDGKDITQLQSALHGVGLGTGDDKAGFFGAGTKRAVTALYRRLGYDVATTGGSGGGDDLLQAARDAVTQAERKVAELKSGAQQPSPTDLRYAEQDLATARQRLADLVAHTGPMVPRAEVAFLPSFPAHVASVNARVGEPVKAPLLTVAVGALVVTGRLDPANGPLVRADMPAQLLSEVSGFKAAGKVTAVGAVTAPQPARQTGPGADHAGSTGSQGGQGTTTSPYIPVTVTPDSPLPESQIGQDVRITIDSARSSGAELAVPLAAIVAGPDTRTYVTKVAADGGQVRVEVTAGVSGDGLVAVQPVVGTLDVGDRVVIGT